MNAHSAHPGGLLLHSVQQSRLFGLSSAGASLLFFAFDCAGEQSSTEVPSVLAASCAATFSHEQFWRGVIIMLPSRKWLLCRYERESVVGVHGSVALGCRCLSTARSTEQGAPEVVGRYQLQGGNK